MALRISQYDGSERRIVLTGMITDETVCARIAALKNGSLFGQPWADLISTWCINYFEQHDKPPKSAIEQIFAEWAESSTDPQTTESIEKFLSYLSNQHEKNGDVSPNFVLNVANRYFNRIRLRRIVDEIQDELDGGRVEDAEAIVAGSEPIALGTDEILKLDQDFELWVGAFDSDRKGIVAYPADLSQFFGDRLCRGSFYAFMGTEKSGKSWWLLDLAVRGLKSGQRVAFFEVGDLGQDQTIVRLAQRLTLRPTSPCSVEYPDRFDDEGNLETNYKTYKEVTSSQQGYRALRNLTKSKQRFRLSCHPNSTISAQGIWDKLQQWAKSGWAADIVVIDYADILAPPPRVRETPDQIDATWKLLRRISQEMHCLLVTATQTSAAAYRGDSILTKRHFSGRKTKLAHVDGLMGINQTPEERGRGIIRLNWIVHRHGCWAESSQVHVAGVLAVGRPIIVTWRGKAKIS